MIDTNKDVRDMPLENAQNMMFHGFTKEEYQPGGLPMTRTPLMLRIFMGREE